MINEYDKQILYSLFYLQKYITDRKMDAGLEMLIICIFKKIYLVRKRCKNGYKTCLKIEHALTRGLLAVMHLRASRFMFWTW